MRYRNRKIKFQQKIDSEVGIDNDVGLLQSITVAETSNPCCTLHSDLLMFLFTILSSASTIHSNEGWLDILKPPQRTLRLKLVDIEFLMKEF